MHTRTALTLALTLTLGSGTLVCSPLAVVDITSEPSAARCRLAWRCVQRGTENLLHGDSSTDGNLRAREPLSSQVSRRRSLEVSMSRGAEIASQSKSGTDLRRALDSPPAQQTQTTQYSSASALVLSRRCLINTPATATASSRRASTSVTQSIDHSICLLLVVSSVRIDAHTRHTSSTQTQLVESKTVRD